MSTTRRTTGFTKFYESTVIEPELGRFRRFAAHLAKKLHDDTEDVLENERVVNDELNKAVHTLPRRLNDAPSLPRRMLLSSSA